MKDLKLSLALPVKIHHVYAINHSFMMSFSNRDIVWFFHTLNTLPCLYETSPHFPLTDYVHTTHSLDHFLSGATIQSLQVMGDILILSMDTKGHGIAVFTLSLRPYKPRYHLDNETGILHQSHHEKLMIQPMNNLNIVDNHNAFEHAFAAELLQPLKKIITHHIKIKTKKMSQYDSDERKAEKATDYQTLVETLLLDQNVDKSKLMSTFGALLDYDHLSFGDLVNACYKKIKKAKSALKEIQHQRLLNEKELTKLSIWLSWIDQPSLNHFNQLKQALMGDHYLIKTTQKVAEVKAHSPYQIQYKNWLISFGKNQKQNDFLTFQYAKKNHVFLHLDGYPSHHVIIHIQTFDIDAIRFASEFLLYLNQREDGTILYAKIGSLKQTKVLGQVIIKDRKTLFVKQSHAYAFNQLMANAIRI